MIGHISCGGDILTLLSSGAHIVNSRFSMAKHYHVASAAEACKLCWLGAGSAFWVWFGLFEFFRRQVSESAENGGPVAGPLLT